MKIKDHAFVDIVKRLRQFEERLFEHPLASESNLSDLYNEYKRKEDLTTKLKAYKLDLKAAMSLLQMDELKARKKVLRRMGYCNVSDVIELKGRVACELSRYLIFYAQIFIKIICSSEEINGVRNSTG